MRITVHIYAYLRYYLPAKDESIWQKEWHLPEGASVSDVVGKLKLPKEVRVTVLVNSSSVDENAPLKEGDTIHVLPQMSGG
jgi:molybdopterin converting factor small subunit